MPELVLSIERLPAPELTTATLAGVDAVVVLTPHAAFDLELVRRAAPLGFDTRAALEPGGNVFRL